MKAHIITASANYIRKCSDNTDENLYSYIQRASETNPHAINGQDSGLDSARTVRDGVDNANGHLRIATCLSAGAESREKCCMNCRGPSGGRCEDINGVS
jgi:hypothetical protein